MAFARFRGSDVTQDSKFRDVETNLLQTTRFLPILSTKIDMKAVNIDVINKWISDKLTEMLGFEDEILIGTIINMIAAETNIDGRRLQLRLRDFLHTRSQEFAKELWVLLIDAQSSPTGIPRRLIETKRKEIMAEQINLLQASKPLMDEPEPPQSPPEPKKDESEERSERSRKRSRHRRKRRKSSSRRRRRSRSSS